MKTVRLNVVTAAVLGVALLCGGYLFGQRPERDISGRRHQNLAAAQRFCAQAFEKITQAQAANEWDMSGHAQKAKDLLDQASHELKEAAEASNEHHEH